jgi:hypothetical protein
MGTFSCYGLCERLGEALDFQQLNASRDHVWRAGLGRVWSARLGRSFDSNHTTSYSLRHSAKSHRNHGFVFESLGLRLTYSLQITDIPAATTSFPPPPMVRKVVRMGVVSWQVVVARPLRVEKR